MIRWTLILFIGSLFATAAIAQSAQPAGKNPAPKKLPRTYADGPLDPYYPHRDYPKLITPQWVGDDGVECVVTLAIDDMRDSARYEAYLRPILDRLQQIDGRAPVSIMSCSVNPADPQLKKWLGEGLSIEVHTFDHPCPCLQGSDFAKAKATYEKCVDLMNLIPGNKPVAFRMPCCDSKNTPSPRFWQHVFNETTPYGNFLQIDSSVFNIITKDDPALPKEITQLDDGSERFRRYLPFPNFVNTINDYPYPYVIGGMCWEFPCVVPSDWSAQHVQKPFNPDTVRDLKLALDAAVIKQGTFNLVFHPHGWIRNDQVVELIDHAVTKHGKKVKFLNFRECLERLNKNLLRDQPIRRQDGSRNFACALIDANDDGYLDFLNNADELLERTIWIWDPKTKHWQPPTRAPYFSANDFQRDIDGDGKLEQLAFRLSSDGATVIVDFNDGEVKWSPLPFPPVPFRGQLDVGTRFFDINSDGTLSVPTGKGLGVNIVPERLQKITARYQEFRA